MLEDGEVGISRNIHEETEYEEPTVAITFQANESLQTSDEHIYDEITLDSNVNVTSSAAKLNQCNCSKHKMRTRLLLVMSILLFGTALCLIIYATNSKHVSQLSSRDMARPREKNISLCSALQNCDLYIDSTPVHTEDVLSEDKRQSNICSGLRYNSRSINFVLMFPEQFDTFQTKARAIVSSVHPNRVFVYLLNSHTNASVRIENVFNVIDLNTDLIMIDGVNEAGVEIVSEAPVSVYGFLHDDFNDNSEGYLAIPIRFASTKYIVATVQPSWFSGFSFISKSTIAIAALHFNTTIEINLKMTGDTLNICLNKYTTFQLSHTSDLSGTIVSATLPILVVTGNPCNYINTRHGCNPFFEMILPTNQLDYFYIIPTIATRHSSTVRIFTLTSTVVKVKAGAVETERPIYERDFHDYIHNDISYVWASTNIMIMIFPHELADNQADAFMMTIHGVHQYLDEYYFAVPDGFTSYLSIVCSCEDTSGFTLDGIALRPEQISITTIAYELLNFSTFTLRINRGAHHMTHVNKTKFGLWVYGNAYYNAYGYPAGISFKTYDKA